MSESGKEDLTFGVPQKHRPVVPAFDPLLEAAREIVGSIAWLRREIDKAEGICSNLQQVTGEMEQSKIAVDATKHVTMSVQRLRIQIQKAHDFCLRLEGISAELSAADIMSENVVMPRAFQVKGGEGP